MVLVVQIVNSKPRGNYWKCLDTKTMIEPLAKKVLIRVLWS